MGYVEDLRKLVGHRPLILTGSIVIILNGQNEVLLQQRKYPFGVWGLPGGLMELSESTEECAHREVWEETGLTIGELELIAVFSGENYFVKAENGDEFFVVTIVYMTKDIKQGKPHVHDNESLQVSFFPLSHLPDKMVGSHRKAIETYLTQRKPI
ncbi:NUDIX hydrolase [Lederbergia sp. NSJ-179]|uniref:NUDIX hydrolase n=1 Tax=Lederbergia sp. NSJ-179 TaxID=2931402 RepID=UPI001FD0E66D|nr:NUDIX hydrolase [Lederbergia sp. NSJ-179]MCJ7840158.1 NUDIX hydrolase [Lederbergia sp. NSJ-179]